LVGCGCYQTALPSDPRHVLGPSQGVLQQNFQCRESANEYVPARVPIETNTYRPGYPERTEIDKGAAQRFIKQAITQATHGKTPVDETPEPSSSARVQPKITSKMLERQLYEKKLREKDARENEEEVLEVFDSAEDDAGVAESQKASHKATAVPPIGNGSKGSNKRRRPVVDPFAGYGDDLTRTNPADASRSETSNPDPSGRRGKKRALEDITADSATGTPRRGVGGSKIDNSKQNSPVPSTEDVQRAKKSKKKGKKSSAS